MTQDEIIDMAIKAEFVSHGKPSEEDSELFVCTDKDILRFAKLVAERALADPMREVQRLGQEIEQKIGCVNHDCDQCKAQPEQEPVAFASHGVINWIADKQFQHEADLYTTPPQQTWVGLNDDEIDYLIHLAYTGDEEFVQTIEAKLKEKNGYAEEKNT